jgi:hypothetical protein
MRVFASIRNRQTWITGWPHSGWRGASATDAHAKVLPFGFDITDDVAGNYLLVCFSADGVYGADTWHETLDEAYASAEEQFGVLRSEWSPAKEKPPSGH